MNIGTAGRLAHTAGKSRRIVGGAGINPSGKYKLSACTADGREFDKVLSFVATPGAHVIIAAFPLRVKTGSVNGRFGRFRQQAKASRGSSQVVKKLSKRFF